MLKLGEMQKLRIARKKDFGVFLEDEEGNSVLLPEKQVPDHAEIGTELEVFLYKDSRDRLIATTKRPLMTVGETARVHVQDVTEIGAFVNIGLEKDVLVPHREMRYELKKGEDIDVYLYVDHSGRLAATMYTKKHENAPYIDSSRAKTYRYEEDSEKVQKLLDEKFGGSVPYTDKLVEPERVFQDFGMSKASFKRALGKLLKDGKIQITKTAIFRKY